MTGGMKWSKLLLSAETQATKEQAEEILKDVNYFGTMLTYMGITEGMVSGAIHSTGDTVRPALPDH